MKPPEIELLDTNHECVGRGVPSGGSTNKEFLVSYEEMVMLESYCTCRIRRDFGVNSKDNSKKTRKAAYLGMTSSKPFSPWLRSYHAC